MPASNDSVARLINGIDKFIEGDTEEASVGSKGCFTIPCFSRWVMDTHSGKLGWWFQIKYFLFASLGEMIPILTNRWRRYFSNWWTPTTKGKDGRWCWFSGTCVAANSLACHRGTIDARTTAGNADGKSLHLTYIYVIPSCMDIIFIESNRELWASARNLHK